MEERPVQQEDGGSKPTPSLQNLKVETTTLTEIRKFVETHHYSKTVNGVTVSHCFKATVDGFLKGAAIFGSPAGYGVLKKYSDDGRFPTVELRRFVLTDELPRNSESRVLSVMFRALKRVGISRILSYADPAHGHQGVIYRATGFRFLGQSGSTRKIVWKGKDYPRRNLLQIHRPFHKALQRAVANGEALYVKVPGKFIYLKDLGS